MSLTPADMKYFDEKFGALGRELHEHALKDEHTFSVVATTLQQAVKDHEKERHNWGKLFAVLSSIIVVTGGVIGAVLWLIERVAKV